MKIVLDVFGGDNAPDAIFDGAVWALKEKAELELILVGKKEYLERRVSELEPALKNRIELAFAEETIEGVYDYSLEQGELTLTEREYGDQMVFVKE